MNSCDPASSSDQHWAEVVLRGSGGHHAFESSVERLATAIRLGVYPTGTALPPERELAEILSVSRATLREAIAALRTAGMVETKRGRGGGTVVSQSPEQPSRGGVAELGDRLPELLDSLEFRRIVEPGAAALAATVELSNADHERLLQLLAEVEAAEERADHRQCDSRLHLAIASVTGNSRVVAAVTGVQADLHDLLQVIPVLDRNIHHSAAQHRAVVHAVLDQDPARARRVMTEHCDDTAALLRGLLASPGAAAREGAGD